MLSSIFDVDGSSIGQSVPLRYYDSSGVLDVDVLLAVDNVLTASAAALAA